MAVVVETGRPVAIWPGFVVDWDVLTRREAVEMDSCHVESRLPVGLSEEETWLV
jgi:hypothetical protein